MRLPVPSVRSPLLRPLCWLVAVSLLSGCAGSLTVEDGEAGLASAVPPVAASDAAPGSGIRDEEGIGETLQAVSRAFLERDPEALRPLLHDPDSDFGRRWLARADNLREVPLASYRLRLDDSLPDLATTAVRDRHGGDTQVLYVVEEHRLEGFDDNGPASEDLFLTFVHDDGDGRWRVAADTDADPLGLVSVDHLWDHGPVTTTGDGPVVALHHPGTRNIPEVLAEARMALRQAAERWPLAWPERVPILVPRDEDELRDLLHVTYDLSNFIAFATATPTGELGEYELTGSRIVLNPDRFLDRDPTTRELILTHELIHVATRPAAGPMIPSWLDEGVAQALGERRSTTGTRLVDALTSGQTLLPTDGEFVVGGRDRIFLSYQLAWSFLEYLRTRFGDGAVASFYESAGRGSVGEPGTERWHVDRAARDVFGQALDELVAAWQRS